MGYVKYTEEQLVERKMAQAAIMAARALLKSQREAKKAKKEGVAQLRRELKTEIRRRKAKKEAVAQLRRALKAEIRRRKEAKLAFGRVLAVLRKVYKPYLAARRKLVRLRAAKHKAVLVADRKLARETAKAAKAQLEALELPPAGTDEDFERVEFNEDDFRADVPPFCAPPSPQPQRRSARLASRRPPPICV